MILMTIIGIAVISEPPVIGGIQPETNPVLEPGPKPGTVMTCFPDDLDDFDFYLCPLPWRYKNDECLCFTQAWERWCGRTLWDCHLYYDTTNDCIVFDAQCLDHHWLQYVDEILNCNCE